MNGVEAFIEIKKTSPKTAVIMITGYSQDEMLELALEEGAFYILHKPLHLKKAQNIIESTKKPAILIADDKLDFTETLKASLEEKGYNIDYARDVNTAIEKVLHFDFEIILLSVKIPGMDGLETFNTIKEKSKDIFKNIINNLSTRGAEGIILGCTEIPLLVDQEDYEIPLFDTTTLHARAAVEFALR